jgi:hypothetical protein
MNICSFLLKTETIDWLCTNINRKWNTVIEVYTLIFEYVTQQRYIANNKNSE